MDRPLPRHVLNAIAYAHHAYPGEMTVDPGVSCDRDCPYVAITSSATDLLAGLA